MTKAHASVDDVLDALGAVRAMLEADGYALTVDDLVDETAHITVRATEAACADCLAPRAVVAEIMLNDLSPVAGVSRVELTYPAGSAAH